MRQDLTCNPEKSCKSCLLSLPSSRQPAVILFNRPPVLLGRGAFITQPQIRAATLLLQLPAKLQLELSQRLNDIRLEQRRSRSITFHRAVGESLELVDHFIKPSRARTGRAPLASQILSFAKSLAYLGRKLSCVSPAVSATHDGI